MDGVFNAAVMHINVLSDYSNIRKVDISLLVLIYV